MGLNEELCSAVERSSLLILAHSLTTQDSGVQEGQALRFTLAVEDRCELAEASRCCLLGSAVPRDQKVRWWSLTTGSETLRALGLQVPLRF